MKHLMTAMLGLSLLVPAMTFAQDTGGDKTKTTDSGKKTPKTKSKSKVKKTKDTQTPTASK